MGPAEDGAGAPRGGGQVCPPAGASPGRGAEGFGVPCCAAPGISVPSPRGRLIPHPQVTSDHDLSPRYRDIASARVAPPWLCSRDPSMPPARLRAHRACALHSRLLSSAEAAAPSLFRSHGVSNRSSLLLQLPFPPFRSSRPSRLGLRRGWGDESEGSRSRRRRRGKSRVGALPSMRTRPSGGEGYFLTENVGV